MANYWHQSCSSSVWPLGECAAALALFLRILSNLTCLFFFVFQRCRGHVFPAAPGLSGGGRPACDVTMHYPRVPWRCLMDQRWPGAGSWQRPRWWVTAFITLRMSPFISPSPSVSNNKCAVIFKCPLFVIYSPQMSLNISLPRQIKNV